MITPAAVITFMKLLETNREELEAERISMPDARFAKNHCISPQRVITLMGPIPDKKLLNGRRVILDPVEVHKLRTDWWSDVRIAKHFHTSNSEVSKQCWDRKSNWFKRRDPIKRDATDPDFDRNLNTKPWPVVKEWKESWRKEWEVVNPGEWPISIFKQFQKWW